MDKRKAFMGWISILMLSIMILGIVMPVQAKALAASSPIPTLAYYYIWYDTKSWDRAKIDYPQLGRYSSDDVSVMRQHILWAKASGIQGFIVSWKNTDVLNRRLEQLINVAEEENFKLAIIYQGLDFDRTPLAADRIAHDLDLFIQRFATRKPFSLFAKPLVIWSGTWKFTPDEIARVTQGRRQNLLILASERNRDGYERLADLVDGNAYYWSSVNPDTFPGYKEKLVSMGEAVHQHGGLWIPSAAPGFDARLVGGTTVVDRKAGVTFLTQINTALSSSPDALGIISWNEFSENSHVEPSKAYGFTYLNILSAVNHLPPLNIGEFDSSQPSVIYPDVPFSRQLALGLLAAIILVGIVIIARRSTQG